VEVVYDDRIMSIVVRLINEDGKWECINKVAHVTVGTRDDSVKPKESNELLGRWLEHGCGGDTNIQEMVFEGRPTLDCAVRGVLSR
jgi:tRNA ligase